MSKRFASILFVLCEIIANISANYELTKQLTTGGGGDNTLTQLVRPPFVGLEGKQAFCCPEKVLHTKFINL